MVRRAVQQAPESGAATRLPERAPRDRAAALDRPISTGNLLADCERWCRDSLPRREPRPPQGAQVLEFPG
ncbi:hypothetical protein ACI782_22475 [Geodermatophilus sp. SYSU D00703]